MTEDIKRGPGRPRLSEDEKERAARVRAERRLLLTPDIHLPEDLQTMDASALGKLIGRSTKSIKLDASRKPDTLPPRFVVPGSRMMRWRIVDVRAWMEALAQVEQEKRMRARELARRVGLTHVPVKGIHIADGAKGAAATAYMKGKK